MRRGKRMLDELEQDMRDHIERETQDNMERGMSREEARYAAVRKFGNVMRVREETRAVWKTVCLEQLLQDVGYGLRVLRKSPGFAAIAIVTLALGVGANAAIFSFVNAVMLKPLPYPQPEQIVSVWEKQPGGVSNPISTLNFLDWERQNHCFQFLSAIAWDKVTLTGSGDPEELNVHRVSAAYFKVLGVSATLGRTFAASENEVGNDREVVLSNRVWQSRFGSDPKVIGRRITLDAQNYTIIGVLPANSEFDRT